MKNDFEATIRHIYPGRAHNIDAREVSVHRYS